MKSIMMLRNSMRHQLASTSKLAASASSIASSSSSSSQQRFLHTSPALDPKDDAADVASVAQEIGGEPQRMSKKTEFLSSRLEKREKALKRVAEFKKDTQLVYAPLRNIYKFDKTQVPEGLPEENLSASISTARHRRLYVPLSTHVFGISPRRDILHSAVVYYLDSLRSGTASTKTRGEVNYGTRKLRAQKGSGMARVGSAGSPTRRGGGVAHGPKPRDFATDLPRRVRELALRSALSAKWQEGRLHVVPSYFWDPPPHTTGKLAQALRGRGWEKTLFLTAPRNPEPATKPGILQRPGRPSALDPVYTIEQKHAHSRFLKPFFYAERNLHQTELIRLDSLTEEAHKLAKTPEDKKKPGELPAYKILHKENLILDLGAVEWLEEKLGGSIFHNDAGEEMTPDEVVKLLSEDEEALEELAEEAELQQQQQQQQTEAAPAAPAASSTI